MNQLIKQDFSFANTTLSLYSFHDENGILWMQAKPFAQALGYNKPADAIINNIKDINYRTTEDVNLMKWIPSNWQPHTKFINESGLYQLIMRSKMPNAIAFQVWVCSEVLPALKNPMIKFQTWLENHPEYADFPQAVGFIYVATNERLKAENIYKIGMTGSLDARLIQLNTSSPDDFSYVYTFSSAHYQELEKYLHNEFALYKVRREFFTLNADDLDEISRLCIKFENQLIKVTS